MTTAGRRLAIAEERPDQAAVAAMMAASDQFHQQLYPSDSNYLVGLEAFLEAHATFLVARLDGRAVGCVGLLEDPRGWGELKRMWVDPSLRGHGIGAALLRRVEEIAEAHGIAVLRLETGIRQPKAIGLYQKSGYVICRPFGGHKEDPLSVFMEKCLNPNIVRE